MGHIISNQGLQVDESKIEAIKDMPRLTDKQCVQRLIEPLRQLIRKYTKFHWDSVHDKCLDQIKTVLSSVPVLKYFDTDKPTVLQCDSSEKWLGACLMQDGH